MTKSQTEPTTAPTRLIVSVPNHPDERALTVVSLPGAWFGYRCDSCGLKRRLYDTRQAAEQGAEQHECPQEDW
jgi:hypothetical protein